MSDSNIDAESLAEHAVMLGLVNNEQAFQAKVDATDGSSSALLRSMLRKGMLTSWQIDRLQKGDPTGFFFGGCKVLFHIAEGTFARVYRGQRQSDGRPVAIKVLRQRFVADRGAIVRFEKEAEAGMRLNHPNIVQIIDYGEQDKKYYMIMEYVEGSNLRDLLKIRVHIDSKVALPLMIGLAKGLKYSIDNGVTHRDIKGTNILVSHGGVAKLVDFGLATIEGEDKKSSALNQRTVDYSALERGCNSPKGDPRSDIFFLGCVFYQMITGKAAMPETESKDILEKMLKRSFHAIKPLGEHRYAPDEELTRVIEKMMKMDLSARYKNMDEVIRDLTAYEERVSNPELFKKEETEDVVESEPIFMYRGDEIVAVDDDASSKRKGKAKAQEEAKKEPEAIAEAEDGSATEVEISTTAPEEDPFDLESFEIKAFHQKQILCVETQSEIQDAFRKSLSKMGYRVFLVSDAELAAERYRESLPDAVIFDADGLGSEGIDTFLAMRDKAHEEGHDLSALVILGPKQNGLRARIPTEDRLIVLGKPVRMKQVQDAISRLIPAG
ncbi:protein kinase domain-containing protein [Singulisphaera rosea]